MTRADPLVWGHGPRVFEVFLEPTCPYSVRAFGKLDDQLAAAGEDRLTVKIRLQSQPWHMFSGVIVRCILAASTLPGGKEAAHREEFEFEHHAGGANMDATPNDITARIERYNGVRWPRRLGFRNWIGRLSGTVGMLGRTGYGGELVERRAPTPRRICRTAG